MPHVLDTRPSALPRSLALSSFSYLTAVVLLLLLRALLPAGSAPPVLELPPGFPPPPDLQNVVEQPPTPVTTPPARPVVNDGPVLPIDQPPARDLILPRQDSMPAWPVQVGQGTGTGNASGPVGGSGGEGAPSDDPRPDEFVWTDSMPVLVKTVLPDYPDVPRQAGMEGTVVLLLQVGRDGRVHRAQVQNPGSLFDDAALGAGRQFVFTPATANGHPVTVWVSQAIRFTLR